MYKHTNPTPWFSSSVILNKIIIIYMIKVIIRVIKPSLCYTKNRKFNKQRLQVIFKTAQISLHTSYVNVAHWKIMTIVNMQWIQFFIELILKIISTWVSTEQVTY